MVYVSIQTSQYSWDNNNKSADTSLTIIHKTNLFSNGGWMIQSGSC